MRKILIETIKDKILNKKEEIEELKNNFLKENVGNVFYFYEVDYLINNVDNYNLSNCCAFAVSDDDSLKDRMKRIKYFIKKYVDSK